MQPIRNKICPIALSCTNPNDRSTLDCFLRIFLCEATKRIPSLVSFEGIFLYEVVGFDGEGFFFLQARPVRRRREFHHLRVSKGEKEEQGENHFCSLTSMMSLRI